MGVEEKLLGTGSKVLEIAASKLIDELIQWIKNTEEKKDKEMLDKIAFKVSKFEPLTEEEQFFMEMKIPDSLSKAFWKVYKTTSSGKEFIETYKNVVRKI